MKFITGLIFSFIILNCSRGFTAELDHSQHEAATETPLAFTLSDSTRQLLVEEMRALLNGMQEIIPALVAGEWQKIKSTGEQMHDSYIMKKSLTQSQLHELHEKLPATFRHLDHNFHHSAGQMAEAASRQDYELVSFYYYKMTEACVQCHSQYASSKFPEFVRTVEHEH